MSQSPNGQTRELVDNRARLGSWKKANLFAISLRENGIGWTGLLALYYLSSALAATSFTRLQTQKAKKGLPGTSSLRMNEEIWTNWDWSGDGEEWTPASAWKQSLITCVLEKYVPERVDVLEIGPGAGRWTEALVGRANHLTGVDISESCVEICRRKFADRPNVNFFKTSGCDLVGVVDGSVDALWSFDVFVHINGREVASYVKEFRRVMRPGAVGVIHHGGGAGVHGGWRSDLTKEQLSSLLDQSGFVISNQFDTWTDGGRNYDVGNYQDVITVFRAYSN